MNTSPTSQLSVRETSDKVASLCGSPGLKLQLHELRSTYSELQTYLVYKVLWLPTELMFVISTLFRT